MSLLSPFARPKSMPGLYLVYDRVLGLIAGMLFGKSMVNAW